MTQTYNGKQNSRGLRTRETHNTSSIAATGAVHTHGVWYTPAEYIASKRKTRQILVQRFRNVRAIIWDDFIDTIIHAYVHENTRGHPPT